VKAVPAPAEKFPPTARLLVTVVLAVPEREKSPLTVATLLIVFAPLPLRVRWWYVPGRTVCAPPA
jgi:hypothetical protein